MKTPNGSSVIPDMLVSKTTEKAPSWSVITHPRIDANMIFFLLALFMPDFEKRLPFMIGL